MIEIAGGILIAVFAMAVLAVFGVALTIKGVAKAIGYGILGIIGLCILIPWMIYGWEFMQDMENPSDTSELMQYVLILFPYLFIAAIVLMWAGMLVLVAVLALQDWLGLSVDHDEEQNNDNL